MKTGILLLLLTQFGVGFGFLPELNFSAEDMEDSLFGAGEVLGNIDATKDNKEAMPRCYFVDENEEEPLKLLVRLKKSPRRIFVDQNKE